MGFLLWQPQLLSELRHRVSSGNNWRPLEKTHSEPGNKQKEQGPGVCVWGWGIAKIQARVDGRFPLPQSQEATQVGKTQNKSWHPMNGAC